MTREQVRDKLGDMVVTLIASGVISMIGGGVGTLVAFRLLEYRVEKLEQAVAAETARNTAQDDALAAAKNSIDLRLSQIASDVAFIRGKLETRP